jgi:NAD(P)H dehydrogenase (quinone)
MENYKPKILVLFYSMYGHMFAMAKAAAEGVIEAGGESVLKQVQELVPEEKWDDGIKAAKKAMSEIPVAFPQEDLKGIDGLIVGVPTRFGNMSAQMRNFWDQTSSDWIAGTLIGKPVSVMSSSATQHGGQETTIISTLWSLMHHGLIAVGLPYSNQEQMGISEISGGSPYGASTITGGMGERMPSENELQMAKSLAKHNTEIAKKLMVK